ncbi:MAG: ABC transporter ATP-binding protein [Dactylosporangium sp.]|nr:ABC transporter ATP-binding protein [Dactylosporangium sp.]NNJ62362.1 ABC transporter ATP-binding protein [Dactylosporangium sp.]
MGTQPSAPPVTDLDRSTGSRVDLHGVGRRYQVGGTEVVALREVELHVDGGEFVVILGPSGSGKTTLLNLIGALDSPTEGQISLSGTNISGATRSRRARIRRELTSFIFQSFNLFPALTALENVQFGADVAGRAGGRAHAADLLARVGLGDRLDHVPHQLSGGEQQRVAIARALATGNPIVLADEPTGELDFVTGVQILRLLQQQAEAGRTVLVVTHNREISRTADRVVELSSGRVVRDGPPPGGQAAVADLHW